MLVIRKAGEKDFQTLIEIMETSTGKEEVKEFVPPEGISPRFLEELKRELGHSDHGVLLAEKDGIPVGFIYFTQKRDHIGIEEIDVRKEHQNQGIGKALVRHVEKIAKERGISRLETGTTVNEEGTPWKAYGFWIHMGFRDAGREIDTLSGLKYVRLIKALAPVKRAGPHKEKK